MEFKEIWSKTNGKERILSEFLDPYIKNLCLKFYLAGKETGLLDAAKICDGMIFKIEGIGDDELHYCSSVECAKTIRAKANLNHE